MCKPAPLGLGWRGVLPTLPGTAITPHPVPKEPLELQMGHPICGTDHGLLAGVAPRPQQQWWVNLAAMWETIPLGKGSKILWPTTQVPPL